MSTNSRIVLSIPPKAEYVSLVRLTASGVANQCGFDLDCIEDLKVCVSEVLNKAIAAFGHEETAALSITFEPAVDSLAVLIGGNGLNGETLFASETDAFALAILDTLMDEVVLSGDETAAVRLVKTTGKTGTDD